MRWRAWMLACPALLAACGTSTDQQATQGARPDPFSGGAIPEQLRGGGEGEMDPEAGLPESFKDDAGTVFNPDEIVFTDPDAENPEREIEPELQELLDTAPDASGPWRQSYTNTFKEARQTDKPVLIWFTNSQFSPNCRQLQEDLFNQQDFDRWAGENLVRLQVDKNASGGGIQKGREVRKADYVEMLRERYSIHGHPTLIVLTPSGEVIGRYKGYRRGQADYKWGQLKQAVILAREAHAEWVERMKGKGYRRWSDTRGRRIFAKLLSYRDGELRMVAPDGTRFRTDEQKLSSKDRAWIEEEKRKRGMQ